MTEELYFFYCRFTGKGNGQNLKGFASHFKVVLLNEVHLFAFTLSGFL